MAKKKRSGSRSNYAKRSYRQNHLKNQQRAIIRSRSYQNLENLIRLESTLAPSLKPNASRFGKFRQRRNALKSKPYHKTIPTPLSSLQGGVVRGGNASPTRSGRSTKNAPSAIQKNIQRKTMPEGDKHYHCRDRPDANKPSRTGSGGSPSFIPWKGTSKC